MSRERFGLSEKKLKKKLGKPIRFGFALIRQPTINQKTTTNMSIHNNFSTFLRFYRSRAGFALTRAILRVVWEDKLCRELASRANRQQYIASRLAQYPQIGVLNGDKFYAYVGSDRRYVESKFLEAVIDQINAR